jgi:hypothetical protein
VGQAILSAVFLLPAICFVVIPLTVSLIKKDRLRLKWVALYTVAGWLVLSVVGWLLNHATFIHPLSLLDAMAFTAIPVLVYGLPIPVAALLLIRPTMSAKSWSG